MKNKLSEEQQMKAAQEAWLEDKPEALQKLARQYPHWRRWKMGEQQEYGIATPGTEVTVLGYADQDMVEVAIQPEHFSDAAKKHMRMLCLVHEQNYARMVSSGIRVWVEAKYLEEYTP